MLQAAADAPGVAEEEHVQEEDDEEVWEPPRVILALLIHSELTVNLSDLGRRPRTRV